MPAKTEVATDLVGKLAFISMGTCDNSPEGVAKALAMRDEKSHYQEWQLCGAEGWIKAVWKDKDGAIKALFCLKGDGRLIEVYVKHLTLIWP